MNAGKREHEWTRRRASMNTNKPAQTSREGPLPVARASRPCRTRSHGRDARATVTAFFFSPIRVILTRINPLRVRGCRAEIERNRDQSFHCKHLIVKWLRKMSPCGAARQSATGDGEWRVARGGQRQGGRASNFGKMVRSGARIQSIGGGQADQFGVLPKFQLLEWKEPATAVGVL